MSKVEMRWIRILRKRKNELQVEAINSSCKEGEVLQSEQGAMIEVGAIIGANLLQLHDDDILEVKLIIHRKEVEND